MKTIKSLIAIIVCSLFLNTNLSAKGNTQEYDKLFNEIATKRIGADEKKLDLISNPFLIDKKTEIETLDGNITVQEIKIQYELKATFNNKAKINDTWFSLNDIVDDYKLVKIASDHVVLKNEHVTKDLYIRKPNAGKIKFSIK